ncbi:MAG: hypothetical protein R3E87_24230 [Burkholderiaceae bacterium]
MSFHVQPPEQLTGHPVITLKQDSYLSMLDMMFASASLFDDHASAVLLTDTRSRLRGLNRRFEVVRSTVGPKSMMLDRTAAQLAYLKSRPITEPIVLTDSDILFNGPLDEVFDQDIDVALTWRKSSTMPINGGMLIFNHLRPDKVIGFMEGLLHVYREHYGDKAGWYGDQLALRDWIGLSYRQMAQKEIATIHGCRIRFLPCERFNHSPADLASEYLVRDPAVAVLHFKGSRKRFMTPYWRAHLALLRRRDPISRLLGWHALHKLRTQAGRSTDAAPALDTETDDAP